MKSDPYSGLLQAGNYVFTTEGHPLSVGHPALQRTLPVPISIIAGPQQWAVMRSALTRKCHLDSLAAAQMSLLQVPAVAARL